MAAGATLTWWVALLLGFAGGVGAALTLAFGETAWYALAEARWLRRVRGAVAGWKVRRRHRRYGRP